MKRQKKFTLNTITDIKVFLLFLLDNIGHPIAYTTVSEILMENVDSMSLDYEECLISLSDEGYLLFDEIDGEKYYMISESGKAISSELYDTLDKEFRERSISYAIKHISLTGSEAKIKTHITEAEAGRHKVTLEAYDKYGQLMSSSMVVNSRSEAEKIARNFENKPDSVYRGILFSMTGRIEYIS